MARKSIPIKEAKALFDSHKFQANISRMSDGCWIWKGSVQSAGYGRIRIGGKSEQSQYLVHVVSFVANKGNIPPEFDLDHLCRNRKCLNPDHLEAVSHKENILRGVAISAINARKTHCPKGHEYTTENTWMDNGSRRCRECMRSRNRAIQRKRQEQETTPEIRRTRIETALYGLMRACGLQGELDTETMCEILLSALGNVDWNIPEQSRDDGLAFDVIPLLGEQIQKQLLTYDILIH